MCSGRASQLYGGSGCLCHFLFLAWSVVLCMLCCPAFTCVLCWFLPALPRLPLLCFLLTVGPLLLALAWGCVMCGLARLVLVGL
jgi:hypothetical protein